MAPEIQSFLTQCEDLKNNNNKNFDSVNLFSEFQSDVFALGLSLFEMVFRSQAYSGNKGNFANAEDKNFSHLFNNNYS